MTMGLYFHNRTNSTAYVAYAYYDSTCPDGDTKWTKLGWFRLAPGQKGKVWSGYVGGRTFYYYAYNSSGEWSGEYPTQVPSNSFKWCWDTGCTTCTTVKFKKINVSWYVLDQTINLTSSIGQGKSTSGDNIMVLPTKLRSRLRKIPMKCAGKLPKGQPVLFNRVNLPRKMK